ncbi:tetratricopeptide repeat-containing sensor histidine kinase [Pontibacter sp. SGAir0037]|uniref:ATP-binding protein n=1 Tax=Pontibacter sp. SGAir0037 TaxID=2571030 RepID=UPI0010CCC42C|nr:tetratricopeptide repeat-containing sensor histidine kinase [Pontibacter sp. SGAir0037]QCR21430.1 hypothetical protein C1N53_03070 [Pontibacter sp. SGAir0037]
MKSILLLLLLLSGTLQAQNKVIDSLQVELSKAQTDSARIMANCNLSKEYLLTDVKKAKEYALAADQLATASGYRLGNSKALNLLGNAYLITGEYDQAMDCHYKALKMANEMQDTASLTASYLNLGSIYFKIKDLDRAVKNYSAASALSEKTNNKKSLGKVYNNLGNVYEEKGEYKKALEFFQKAAALQEEIGDKKSWAISLHNIGNVHLYFDHPEEGLPYLFESVRLNQELHHDMILMASLGRIAKIYQAVGNRVEALKYARQSLAMAEKVESGKKIAEAAQLMHEIYASLQQYDLAYKYQSLYTRQSELMNAESRTKIESELTAKYETEQKELENANLRAESDKKALEIAHHHKSFMMGAALTVLLFALLIVVIAGKLRLRTAFKKLQEAHLFMQRQHTEIVQQKNEICSQALVLKEQNERLGKLDGFKNKVFSIVSHDLRSPLNSIKGILGLAKKRTMTEQEVKHIFGLLEREMSVAMSMLDNVLIWAKAQLKESSVELKEVDLHIVADENIYLAVSEAEKKGVQLINGIAANKVAVADKERLNFVLRNLLMNAIKFSYAGGEIRLTAEEQEEKVVLAIRDHGKGILPEHLAGLFTEKRYTTLGTSNEKGTGLGLMLSKELLESINGSIQVESEAGKGSTFFIVLPKAVQVRRETVV